MYGPQRQLYHQVETLKGVRTIFRSKFLNRLINGSWLANGGKSAFETARHEVAKRLQSYQKPEMDPKLDVGLTAYVAAHKKT